MSALTEDAGADERSAKRARLDPAELFPAVRENDVGITEFTTGALPGFHGVIKERYTDFLVNEIAEDGTVVRLTSFAKPAVAASSVDKGDAEARLVAVIGAEQMSKLAELDANTERKTQPVMLEEIAEKAARTAVHEGIRALFPNLASDSQDGAIRVVRRGGKPGNRRGAHSYLEVFC